MSRDWTVFLLVLSVFCVIISPSIILAAINLFFAGYHTGVLMTEKNGAGTETEVVVSAEKEEENERYCGD